jgi:septal ring factor EnvC (AmiA/AmiB activator)
VADESTELLKSITRLETKMEQVLKELKGGDMRFEEIDKRLRYIEGRYERLIAYGTIGMLVVTVIANMLARWIMP